MARIRTYKPEIFTDSATGRLSGDAFKLYLGLLSHSDDYGFIGADVPEIIAEILPFWGLSRMGDVARLLEEIASAKKQKPQPLLAAVEHDGATFFVLPNFRRHQKVDHPARPLIPTIHHKRLSIHGFRIEEDGSVLIGDVLPHAYYDDNSANPREASDSPRESSRGFDEDSANPRESSPSPRSRARADLRDRKDRKDQKDLGERAHARETGALAPEPPPPSSPSASADPEPEASTRLNTLEGVRRQWNRAARVMGHVAGKCSTRDLRECLANCPDPLDREMSFELAFCETEPPPFNFFVSDLTTWVARARKDAADAGDDLDRRRQSMLAAEAATLEASEPPASSPPPPPRSVGEIMGGVGGDKPRKKTAEEQRAELLKSEERKRA